MKQGSRRLGRCTLARGGGREAVVECGVGGGLNDLEGGGLTTPIVAIGRA